MRRYITRSDVKGCLLYKWFFKSLKNKEKLTESILNEYLSHFRMLLKGPEPIKNLKTNTGVNPYEYITFFNKVLQNCELDTFIKMLGPEVNPGKGWKLIGCSALSQNDSSGFNHVITGIKTRTNREYIIDSAIPLRTAVTWSRPYWEYDFYVTQHDQVRRLSERVGNKNREAFISDSQIVYCEKFANLWIKI